MRFSEVQAKFNVFQMTNLYPDHYFRSIIHSAWAGERAAGSHGHYMNNPQMRVSVPEPPPGLHPSISFMLEQEDTRWTGQRATKQGDLLKIQLKLLRAPSQDSPVTDRLTSEALPEAILESSGGYSASRCVCLTVLDVDPGEYVLVASTEDPGQEGPLSVTTWAPYAVHVSEIGGENEHTVLTEADLAFAAEHCDHTHEGAGTCATQ
eukprot:TRINITY_DN33653_c0_g1_i1.p1 TRINITY_DN33653_c0_g1~~TRINITY_DN33653_c0_g1_i1.p1  ORF type:complete len:207 (+),score=54.59 TRINITY_DN33653_c0_g1_i1:70-690(+)